MRDSFSKQENLIWVTWVAFGFAIVTALIAVFECVAKQQWPSAIVLALSVLLAVGILLWLNMRPLRAEACHTAVFQPFADTELIDPWPRKQISDELSALLGQTRKPKVLVVAGDSGAGKTVALKVFLDNFGSDKCLYVDTYSTDLSSHLNDADYSRGNCSLIIFDQFEQYFARLAMLDHAQCQKERDAMLKIISESKNQTFLFAIRSEWVYEMKFLGKYAPKLNKVIEARPLVKELDTDNFEAIKQRLETVLNNPQLANNILEAIISRDNPLPIEIPIVGSIIEASIGDGETITLDWFNVDLGGVRGAVDNYLEGVLKCSPDRRITAKVLCALSVQTKFRQQQSLTDILDALFEHDGTVKEVLAYLEQRNLVVKRSTTYQLAHDYLASEFSRLTTSELDLDERENTRFHAENNAKNRACGIVLPRKVRAANTKINYARILISLLFVAMVLRLIIASTFWTPFPEWGMVHPSLGGWFDRNYIPVFITHFVWACYVLLYYEGILSCLKQNKPKKLLSRFVVLNMCLCVVAAMFFPSIWICSIGWGGCVVGIQAIAVGARKDINKVARNRMYEYGRLTCINSIFITVVGVFVVAMVLGYNFALANQEYWFFVSSLCGTFLTLVGIFLSQKQVYARGASGLLGLLARPKAVAISTHKVQV